ncbi:hypothetical protein CEXT_582311 [Caerostris extrusa]|uniref:Uncharacterized protein n=1 Tax=Caerostris extrusa TaxID=172846 RepID=A0AAV4QXC1_CAEEX|nr:hypothetical protein CEXT_582311 [Caerostris extrusa]
MINNTINRLKAEYIYIIIACQSAILGLDFCLGNKHILLNHSNEINPVSPRLMIMFATLSSRDTMSTGDRFRVDIRNSRSRDECHEEMEATAQLECCWECKWRHYEASFHKVAR